MYAESDSIRNLIFAMVHATALVTRFVWPERPSDEKTTKHCDRYRFYLLFAYACAMAFSFRSSASDTSDEGLLSLFIQPNERRTGNRMLCQTDVNRSNLSAWVLQSNSLFRWNIVNVTRQQHLRLLIYFLCLASLQHRPDWIGRTEREEKHRHEIARSTTTPTNEPSCTLVCFIAVD